MKMKTLPLLSLAISGSCATVSVPSRLPRDINEPVGEAFISFSVEFSWFPEFSGNLSTPNAFSNQLLSNLGAISGVKPYVRVGGNSQDNAIYDPDLEVAYNHTYGNPEIPYPTSMTYGRAFFEGYRTLPGVRLSHGFNLGANETNGGFENLAATLPLVCEAIDRRAFAFWEMGNEADHYESPKSNRGPIREAATWTAEAYVADWQNRTKFLAELYTGPCADKPFRFLGPSHAGLSWVEPALVAGLDEDGRLGTLATHHYIAGSTDPTVTLRGTLLNHTLTAEGLASQARTKAATTGANLPYIIGEGNSLFNQGRKGASDVFGAALWSIDFSLLAASVGIRRVHFHQGVNYNYAAWQPSYIGTTQPGTKAPYYGHVAAAAALGRTDKRDVQVAELPLDSETDSAYAIYEDGRLARVAVMNMREYNASTTARPERKYDFVLKGGNNKRARVQRLMADGADAVSGIAWDGISFNYELDGGKPVMLHNMTGPVETVKLRDGKFSVSLLDSSFALVSLK